MRYRRTVLFTSVPLLLLLASCSASTSPSADEGNSGTTDTTSQQTALQEWQGICTAALRRKTRGLLPTGRATRRSLSVAIPSPAKMLGH